MISLKMIVLARANFQVPVCQKQTFTAIGCKLLKNAKKLYLNVKIELDSRVWSNNYCLNQG